MQTKIDPLIWATWRPYPVETRMAMIWMQTNARLTTAGYCLAEKDLFEFETLLDWSDFERACEAFGDDIFILPEKSKAPSMPDACGMHAVSMPDACGMHAVSMPDACGMHAASIPAASRKPAPLISRRYWIKSFIRKQYAEDGPSLCKSKVSGAIVRAIVAAHSEPLKAAVLAEYPSLRPLFSSSSEEKTTPSGCGMHAVSIPHAYRRRGEERSGEEWNGEERSGKEGVQRENQPQPHEPSSSENKKPRAPEDIVPAPELLDRLGVFFHREKNSAIPKQHDTAMASTLKASEKELATVEAFYRIAMADPKTHYPKKSLSSLMSSFQDELDKARTLFALEPHLSPEKKFAADWEPEGWREAVLARFPGALVHEFRTWWDLDRDLREMFPQFPASKKKAASEPDHAIRTVNPAAA
jgi:hypothetical protein